MWWVVWYGVESAYIFKFNLTITIHVQIVCLAADIFFYTFAHGGNILCGSFFRVHGCKGMNAITHQIKWQ